MKKQASLSILKVNNPFNTIAPSGSLLLCATDEGLKLYNENGEELQIGGSSNIQHIFKVSEFPTSGMVDNSIYVTEAGEVKAYFAEGWIDISQEVVETIDDSASNDNIPTTKAVKDYIDANSGSSIDLSNYYNKAESDEKFALKDDVNSKLALSVVEDFPTSGTNNTMYIADSSEARVYTDGEWKNISIEVVKNFDTPNQTTVPTTKAVYDFVSSASGSSVDLTNYNGNVSLHTTNSEQGWMASYFVADGQKIQMEYTNAENNSFAIASSNFIGIGVYKIEGKESIEITNNNILISTSNLTYNGFNTNTGNGLVELVDGKIPSGLYNSGSSGGLTAEDISGAVISETVKTIKAGENIEFSEQDGVLTIKGTELESREDISFTTDSLNDGKLTVSECSIGSCCVMDNNGNLVMPDQQQSGSDVILNLSGYTITGTWKVKFIQGRTGGVTPEYAQQMATTYAIIFGS